MLRLRTVCIEFNFVVTKETRTHRANADFCESECLASLSLSKGACPTHHHACRILDGVRLYTTVPVRNSKSAFAL